MGAGLGSCGRGAIALQSANRLHTSVCACACTYHPPVSCLRGGCRLRSSTKGRPCLLRLLPQDGPHGGFYMTDTLSPGLEAGRPRCRDC